MSSEHLELPPEFWQAVDEFNRGDYYDCHDTLEALWMEASEPERSFYQGILQIAVALYHYGNDNQRGAMILLGEGMRRLRPYPQFAYGIDLAALLAQGNLCLQQLQQQSQAASEALIQPSALPMVLPRICLAD